MLHLKQRHQLTIQKQQPAQMRFFELSPIADGCKLEATTIDFSPVNGISLLPKINKNSTFLPCLFTSSLDQFLIKSNDQKQGDSVQEILTETFQEKVSKAKEQACPLRKILLKPKPLSNYCQICKQKFSDYEQHVNHVAHKRKMSQNEFTKHIERFASNFQLCEQNSFKRSKPMQTKVEKKLNSYATIQRQVKKIVISRQECKSISITKLDSVMSEEKAI